MASPSSLHHTPLHALHQEQGGKMVPFAGYHMPLHYTEGILQEHHWVRNQAGLFDVSHMGQAILEGPGATALLMHLTPSPFTKTPIGRAKYTVLLNEAGGIIDDFIVTRLAEDRFFLVINASRKDEDISWIGSQLPEGVTLTPLEDRALLALQGPKAEGVLAGLVGEGVKGQGYMQWQSYRLEGGTGEEIWVSRLGYTGEDGFEISVPGELGQRLWQQLCSHAAVKPVGLGARDGLRLEMGYPLYGQDLDETTSPIEAGLGWVVRKKNTDFLANARIIQEREQGPKRRRMGVQLLEKGIARHGCPLLTPGGGVIGTLSSGGFSPELERGVGQGYINAPYDKEGEEIIVEVRGKQLKARLTPLSHLAPRTKQG